MAKLTMTSFVTLDGVMQAPGAPQEDQSGGFSHGGWVHPFDDEKFGQFMVEVFGRAGAFLLGRGTWQIFASYWPRHDDPKDPIATSLNALPKYVASRTLDRLDWRPSTLVRDVPTEVAKLKQQVSGELQVHGSPGLAQTLLKHELAGTRTTGKGVVITTFRRTGRPSYGSFA